MKGKGGIENVGNSCYVNASVQMLSRTLLGEFAFSMKNEPHDKPMLSAFWELVEALRNSNQYHPISFQKAHKFKEMSDINLTNFYGYNQEDSH